MDSRREEDDTITKLYEASMEGSVLTFNSLIQKNPLILSKISLTNLGETPLHISALLGHLNFTRQLLTHKPKLTSELDCHNRSPLHLASAEGHAEIVQALLQENEDMCLVQDEDGRIPLHYAAMRGRVDVIKLLISAKKRSIFVVNLDGETVLHLCVQYNNLQGLKVLVESVGCENREFLNMKEHAGGNTILHLAVLLKQTETVKYLLSVPGVRSIEANSLNNKGLRASDLVHHHGDHYQSPRDFKTLKIQRIFNEAYQKATTTASQKQNKSHDDDDDDDDDHKDNNNSLSSCGNLLVRWWRKLVRYMKYKGEWMEDKRGSIMVVATVIGTVSFEVGMNPPGGVWGDNSTTGIGCSKDNMCIAGTSILSRSFPELYDRFLVYNSISFLASISTILLLISGVPVKNKICMWLLTVSMCLALTFMAFAFLDGMILVTPDAIFTSIFPWLVFSWLGFLVLVCVIQTIRFFIWLVRKFRRCFFSKRKKQTCG